jgi:hypothetical protein
MFCLNQGLNGLGGFHGCVRGFSESRIFRIKGFLGFAREMFF